VVESARVRPNQKMVVGIVFVMATFMAALDITIVNVALPTIGREFHVPPQGVDAAVTGYLVSLAVFIPASGWLGDRFGTKRVLLVAIAIFTGASALCGQAQGMTELVVFRILQGVGGGMMTPVGMAMLFRTFPPHERVRASRILVVPTAMAPALGPVIGGLFVTHLSWRWVFYVNLPIGIIAIVFGALFLVEHREARPGTFDLPGFVLAGAGFASVMYSISVGPERGWGSPLVIATGIGGAVLIAVLAVVELRTPEPMLDLRLLRDRLFRTTTMVLFLTMASFLGTLYMMSLFYQDGLGLSALLSGLGTFPEAVGVMIGAQIAGRLYPRIGPRRIIAGALLGFATVMVLLSRADYGTSLWYLRGLMFLLGIFLGHAFVPIQASAFSTIHPQSMGRASGLFNASRQLASAVGVAVVTTVLAAAGTTRTTAGVTHPSLEGYHWAFVMAASIALMGAFVALFIKDSDAAATMGTEPVRREERVGVVQTANDPAMRAGPDSGLELEPRG
jgi:EmrB/QacA subfamily drug resistance transporter